MKKVKTFFLLLGSTATILMFCSCTKEQRPGPAGNGDQNNPGSTSLNVNVTTVAGKRGERGNAEDGNGVSARFWNPGKMVFDSRNNMLYIADGSVIRSMDMQYNVSTYVPLRMLGSSFNDILDIALAPGNGGSLYVTTKENDLWKIEPDGDQASAINIINRVYSGNAIGSMNSGDHFDLARGLATGANGEIYFFNQSWATLHRIRLSSLTEGVVEIFAGKAENKSGGDGNPYPFLDGKGELATFGARVSDIASDANGNIYVADFDNNLVRKITPDATVTSLFPFKTHVGVDVDGPIAKAESNNVLQVATTDDGNFIFFTTYGYAGNNLNALRMVRPGKDVITLAGYSGHASYGDGPGTTAGLGETGGIAATPDGKTIFVSEPGQKVIRKVTIE
ncbi:hypothetical protein QTN47_01990 [Danxiaibacter flavus]|uniref:Uncharacterized protein n=1 Tax=Danxiaibacter flavus TaxID=3049108 RepID=A0ABV3Z8R3_9BACT|nr:hypothetical protein QNM32_01990 [Chitinophagaceae bacterium DXS]